ncbi:MAG: polysaccharide biosynthesis/export family protein [Terracidiphilus sp.]
MPDARPLQRDSPYQPDEQSRTGLSRSRSTTSLRELWEVLVRRRLLAGSVLGGLLLLCLLYCLIAPSQYEASAKVALRQAPASSLRLEAADPLATISLLSAPLQLETLADIFRSDRLAWRVITELKLYREPGFVRRFDHRFPGFHADAPSADAQDYLLVRFQKQLRVQTLPRTLLIQIRFRSRDAALSAAVVNALIRAYDEQETESRVQATVQQSGWLENQLKDMKSRMEREQQRLTAFESEHGIIGAPSASANAGQPEPEHNSTLLEIDELGRQLVAVSADRILREAEYRAASEGDPELVIASDPGLQTQGANFATAMLAQLRARRSELEQEQAQLSAEHGPNFPRVVEIQRQLLDIDKQKQTEDAKLVAQFQSAFKTASDREQAVRKSLDERTGEGMKRNQAATEYAVMRQEADSSHDVYQRVLEKVEEAGLSAGVHSSNIAVVDSARQPVKPVTPDLPLYMSITFFVGLWLAVGGALLVESLSSSGTRAAAVLLAVFFAGALAHGQAPTPTTSGLPSGVVRIPSTPLSQNLPNPQEAPTVWNNPEGANQTGLPPTPSSAPPMAAPIAPGDSLEVSEYHTPEFRSVVRVSPAGTVTLPMVHEVEVNGMDEQAAARAIEAALVAKGMLLHPQVSVMVLAHAGQDVSVLGEVARPGVYPYTLHHRLLDLISAASGLGPNAGRLVNVFHRDDPKTPHPVVLDPSGTDTAADHNPELAPGDTVQVSRAGLVYVIGDVVRPGGFPVDPAQGLTVVQALSLAWGTSQNAATGKALLIREQKGGRTMTTLNLKRMIHGQEPDQPVHDRDILFVPDSAAKEIWNKSVEAAIQSAIGVTIYAGLVYSQRF